MNKAQKSLAKKTAINFLGGVGYFFAALQWVMVFVVYQTSVMAFVTSTTPDAAPPPPPPPIDYVPTVDPVMTEPNLFVTIVGSIVVLAIIALSIFVLVRAPIAAARASKKVVQSAATAAAPMILRVQHKPDTPKRRNKVVGPLIFAVKCIVVIVPCALLFMAEFWGNDVLDPGLSRASGMWLGGLAVLFFALQYLVARIFKIKTGDIA